MATLTDRGNRAPGSSSLTIFSCNIRSLRNKVDDLVAETSRHDPDVIAIQESWLDPHISDSSVSISNFSLFRRDRATPGGGVAIYINDTRLGVSVPPLSLCGRIELLCVDIHSGARTTRVCNTYRPPNSARAWYEDFHDDLDKICDTEYDIILVGDVNLDFMNPHECRPLKNIFNSFSFSQLIDQPTRFGNSRNSCLDILATRNSNKTVIHHTAVTPHLRVTTALLLYP